MVRCSAFGYLLVQVNGHMLIGEGLVWFAFRTFSAAWCETLLLTSSFICLEIFGLLGLGVWCLSRSLLFKDLEKSLSSKIKPEKTSFYCTFLLLLEPTVLFEVSTIYKIFLKRKKKERKEDEPYRLCGAS